jgi:hypothetical protein
VLAPGAALFVLAAALGSVALLDEVGPHDEGLVLSPRGASPGASCRGGLLVELRAGPARAARGGVGGPRALAAVVADPPRPGRRGVAVLAWRLARRWGGDPRWAAAAGVAAGAALAWPLTPNPNAFALVPGLGAVVLAPRRPGAAGGLAALAAWLRPELGLALRARAAWEARGARGRDADAGTGGAWRLLAVAAGGTLALFAPFVLAAPRRFAEDLTGFLAAQDLQRLPLQLTLSTDPNKLLEGAFPALLLAGAAVWLAARRGPVALLPLGLAGLLYLLGRADEFHLVPLAVVVAIGAAVAGARASGALWRAALGAAVAVIALHGIERQAVRALNPPALAAVPGGVGDGVRTTAADSAALRRWSRRSAPRTARSSSRRRGWTPCASARRWST